MQTCILQLHYLPEHVKVKFLTFLETSRDKILDCVYQGARAARDFYFRRCLVSLT